MVLGQADGSRLHALAAGRALARTLRSRAVHLAQRHRREVIVAAVVRRRAALSRITPLSRRHRFLQRHVTVGVRHVMFSL